MIKEEIKKSVPELIAIICLMIVFITFFILAFSNNSKYMFICTDYKGNTIYCKRIDTSNGSMIGITEDNTYIKITSYKRIKESEVK